MRALCICSVAGVGSTKLPSLSCPYRIIKDLLWVKDRDKCRSKILFSTDQGRPVTKSAMADTYNALGGFLPEGIRPKKDCYSGHTSRVSGARHYARLGLTIPQICYIGRWRSEAMAKRYIGDAVIDEMAKNRSMASTACNRSPMAASSSRSPLSLLGSMSQKTSGLPRGLEEATQRSFF